MKKTYVPTGKPQIDAKPPRRSVIKKILPVLFVSLLSVPATIAAAPAPDSEIASPLTTIAAGKDKAFGAMVAPAESVDAASPRDERIRAVIQRMSREIDSVRTAFMAASADKKIAMTKAAVAQFSPETARDGAARSFEGSGPGISVMRQLLFVPAAHGVSADMVMQTVSQFERSPKADDDYYEYSDPADLAHSTVATLSGPQEAIKAPQVRSPMVPERMYALKKCRHIPVLGWFCNTSLYQVRDLAAGNARTRTLLTFLRPLPKGADNSTFKDDRAKNTADGYTALYVVEAADNLVLVYSLGIQSKAAAVPREGQGRLNDGQKQEYRELVNFAQTTLGTGTLPF